jgi:hypothetical protein
VAGADTAAAAAWSPSQDKEAAGCTRWSFSPVQPPVRVRVRAPLSADDRPTRLRSLREDQGEASVDWPRGSAPQARENGCARAPQAAARRCRVRPPCAAARTHTRRGTPMARAQRSHAGRPIKPKVGSLSIMTQHRIPACRDCCRPADRKRRVSAHVPVTCPGACQGNPSALLAAMRRVWVTRRRPAGGVWVSPRSTFQSASEAPGHLVG